MYFSFVDRHHSDCVMLEMGGLEKLEIILSDYIIFYYWRFDSLYIIAQ